jgi:hypothetical protein
VVDRGETLVERPTRAWVIGRRKEWPGGQKGKRKGSGHYRPSYADAESIELDIDVAPEADGRADVLALITPGAAADDAVAWLATLQPCGSVRWRAIVVLVPGIFNPLPDIAVHVVKPKRVRLEQSNGRCVFKIPGTTAAIAISVTREDNRPRNSAYLHQLARRTPIPPQLEAGIACQSIARAKLRTAWHRPSSR